MPWKCAQSAEIDVAVLGGWVAGIVSLVALMVSWLKRVENYIVVVSKLEPSDGGNWMLHAASHFGVSG